jgi:hypothetical protein
MCRFHFLLNRFRERGIVASLDANGRADHVANKSAPWRSCYPLRSDFQVDSTGNGYIERWIQALES